MLNSIKNNDFVNSKIISIEKFFECNDSIVLEEKQMKLFLNGVMINSEAEGLVKIYDVTHQFIGIGIATNGKLKRKIILKE